MCISFMHRKYLEECILYIPSSAKKRTVGSFPKQTEPWPSNVAVAARGTRPLTGNLFPLYLFYSLKKEGLGMSL